MKEGMTGTTVTPSEKFTQQIENIFLSGQKWDAFLINGQNYCIELCRAAEKFGMVPEKDFKIFTSHSCQMVSYSNN